MTNFTVEQIEAAMEPWVENGDGWGEYNVYVPQEDRVLNDGKAWKQLVLTIDGVPYEVTEVDRTGGMDEGSNLSSTISIGTQFFRKSGYYASYHGSDWDGPLTEVRPEQKEITIYVNV